ncbi:MAG: hypothetical protein H6774_04420 [Pseudomonadales bacterium]|nr:hypothetical protein [Pseudomonadales bacterium]
MAIQDSIDGMVIRQKHSQRGQIAVIVLLLMAVVLTVGLSVAVRTSDDLGRATQQSESTKVLNAAETGIERALQSGNFSVGAGPQTVSFSDDGQNTAGSYTITPTDTLEVSLLEGEVAEVQLEGFTSDRLDIEWAKEGDINQRASLIAAVYYSNGLVEYHAIGQPNNNNGNARGDDFDGSTTISSGEYKNSYSVPLQSTLTPLKMRLHPVYAGTDLVTTVIGTVQAHDIVSTARNTANEGADSTEQHSVSAQRILPAVPAFMDYSLYAEGEIQQVN